LRRGKVHHKWGPAGEKKQNQSPLVRNLTKETKGKKKKKRGKKIIGAQDKGFGKEERTAFSPPKKKKNTPAREQTKPRGKDH